MRSVLCVPLAGAVLVALPFVVSVVALNGQAPTAADKPHFDKIEEVAKGTLAAISLNGNVSTNRVTLNPGTKAPEHNHNGRIAVAVMIQGTVTEHRGTEEIVYKVGDIFMVPEGAVHWLENKGTVTVLYAETNIRPN